MTGEDGRAPASARRDVRASAVELVSLRRLAAQQTQLAAAAALASALSVSFNLRLAVAFGAGVVAEAVLAHGSRCRRRRLLLALAADREAYTLAEVRCFGTSLTAPKTRRTLALSIAAALRESSRSDSIYMLDRVAAAAPALVLIAQALADDATVVEPTAMAALMQLLTDGAGSPLLNAAVAADELDHTLAPILAGIRPAPETASAERCRFRDRAA